MSNHSSTFTFCFLALVSLAFAGCSNPESSKKATYQSCVGVYNTSQANGLKGYYGGGGGGGKKCNGYIVVGIKAPKEELEIDTETDEGAHTPFALISNQDIMGNFNNEGEAWFEGKYKCGEYTVTTGYWNSSTSNPLWFLQVNEPISIDGSTEKPCELQGYTPQQGTP